uniref:Hepatoma-derived growth factor-related protein 2 n=1 Tax=Mesocestoides corti TaxID=53468 RepID=A0A5K3FN31_MESCO
CFQEYLTNSGGRTGGWKDFSHQTFLKIRRRYVRQNSTTSDEKSDNTVSEDVREQFYHEVMSTLGLKSIGVVASHEEWFTKLAQLEAASKRALRDRRLRQAETQSARRSSCGGDASPKPRLKSAPPTNRQQQRALLDAWREAREREAAHKLEEERRAKDEEQRLVARRRSKRNEALKAKLARFRQKREQAMSSARLAQNETFCYDFQQATKPCLSQVDKDRIRERTNHLLQVKMERKAAKSRAQEEQEMRITRTTSMLAVQVERDPHRATGPTEIWKIRIQALEDEKKKPSSKPIVAAVASNRRQRAIPEWRRRVSLV